MIKNPEVESGCKSNLIRFELQEDYRMKLKVDNISFLIQIKKKLQSKTLFELGFKIGEIGKQRLCQKVLQFTE